MAQKNDTQLLLVAMLICLGIVGFGGWWFLHRGGNTLLHRDTPTLASSDAETAGIPVKERFSEGEKILIYQNTTMEKEEGISAIATGDWQSAITELEASLAKNPNDPEALIYLNNARIGNQNSYVIAALVPITSQLDGAQELLRGVAQAQAEINQKGGINGTPVRIIIGDDSNDGEIAADIARALVEDDRVLGAIGHFSSQVSLAAANIYQQGELVAISPTSTSVDLSTAGSYIFRTVPSDRFTGTTLSRYLLQTLDKQKVAIFYNSESNYSQSLTNAFTTALLADGGETVAEFDLSSVMFNPSSAVKQAVTQGAEAIVLATDSTVLNSALDVIVANDRQLPLLGGDSLYKATVLEKAGNEAEAMVVTIPWHILANLDSPFSQSSLQLWKAQVNWRTALAYDALLVLAEAIATDPTRSGIQQALGTLDVPVSGASGPIRFLPSGDRNQALQLVKIEAGDRTGFGYDFVPINE
ncbi:ABC transporter substrate-binding protein [Roseofilum casamattae]|uniref:ABC transporter substrate-binding protein n=1 Tax=Roseofilum casamattae BLCC-M143 TaxID=3022442 RepID=A0ABT7BSN6_9CYAN|nr:ABC transporter substrate-binding protein [Roseofilum casamattae]MDJ1182199.1 ABC transporter substrate-binding protein [Roseofilum casamattae BLCC-M143]